MILLRAASPFFSAGKSSVSAGGESVTNLTQRLEIGTH